MQRKLRMGMVGGGPGAFIGNVHRIAAQLDGDVELVAGCFSRDADKNRTGGERWHIAPGRIYPTYQEMAEREAALPPGERIDFVSIVTPNYLHYPVAKAFIAAGINVVSDKPATVSLDEALRLRTHLQQANVVYALTHNYTGYPMVREARAMVRAGKLGRIQKVVAEYPQGWLLATALASGGQINAGWRIDPSQGGQSNATGDIGTHAENLCRYITGLHIERLCADFGTFVPGNPLEDDANILVRFRNDDPARPQPRGIIYASQMSTGEENGPHIRVYGDQASLEWHQPEPNTLTLRYHDRPAQVYRTAGPGLSAAATAATRLPAGHPEGFIEAFANVYRSACHAIRQQIADQPITAGDFPGIDDAIQGMAFIETCVESARNDAKWTEFVAGDR